MEAYLHYLTLPYLLQGAALAVQIAIFALLIGVALGLVLALMRMSSVAPIRWIAAFYVWLIRGTPLLLQLVFIYDALPVVGIVLDPVTTAIIGFGLNEAAFAGEIIRGGISSVSRTQSQAAASLGMSQVLTMRRIVLPQAMRAILPALGNDAISVLKNTSLASVLSVSELTLRSQSIVALNFQFFPVFFAAATMYLALTTVIAGAQALLERRYNLERRGEGPGAWDRLLGLRLGPFPRIRDTGRPDAIPAVGKEPQPSAPASGTRARVEVLRTMPWLEGASREKVSDSAAHDFLEVRNVWKAYGRRQVLEGVDFTVDRGQVFCIMGPSGSGKSTLLRLINHLEAVDAGEILLRGELVGYDRIEGNIRPVRNLAKARAAARIGMVFQHFNLFEHFTAVENIIEAPTRVYDVSRADAEVEARALLEMTGLAQHADHLPHRLSGGQQQRVAIARALAIHPRLMLFDEPTSALDPELVGDVLRVMRQLAQEGMTMIVVTHEVQFARDVADRVLFMADGKIVEQGSPAEVIENPQEQRTQQFLSQVGREEGTF